MFNTWIVFPQPMRFVAHVKLTGTTTTFEFSSVEDAKKALQLLELFQANAKISTQSSIPA